MQLSGVFAPLPTPFDADDRLDLDRLTRAYEQFVAGPLTGFVVLGSNGEAALMDDDESDRAIAAARGVIPAGRRFIVGTGRESTRAAIAATKRAADLGADAVLVRTPGFFKSQMTADVFVQHYTEVADASPVPVLLYNFTAVTGVNLPVAAAARLATHSNIIGMKESGGDVAQLADLVASTPASFTVLAGSATTTYAALCAGVGGAILALAAVVPDACLRLYTLTRESRHHEARALQRELVPLARLLSGHGVAGLKAALAITGIDAGGPRRPLAPVPGDVITQLRQAFARLQEVTA
jgi:dihydrodipicolinate synthase/N-acetylneuraminate lyase